MDNNGKKKKTSTKVFTVLLSVNIIIIVGFIVVVVIISNAWNYSLDNNLWCKENKDAKKSFHCSTFYDVFEPIEEIPTTLLSYKSGFEKSIAIYMAKMIINFNVNIQKKSIESMAYLPMNCERISNIFLKFENSPLFASIFEQKINPKSSCSIVVIRGTATSKEWIFNRKTYQTNINLNDQPLRLHHGFWLVFSQIRDQLDSYFRTLPQKKRVIYFTGNSLGGAVSVIASTLFQRLYPHLRMVCYNFAKPKVGNPSWTIFSEASLKNRIYRIWNTEDLVTQLPLPVLINLKKHSEPWIYSHEGQSILISQNMKSISLNHSLYLLLHHLEKDEYHAL